MKKPSISTIDVTLDSGKVVKIGRCALAKMDTLLEAQSSLIEAYIECDGAVGAILMDSDVIATLTLMCSVLPIHDTDEFLKYEDICQNWEQLVLLFFNGGLNPTTREVSSENILNPSWVASLHFLPYVSEIKKFARAKRKKEEEELLKEDS
jgi:hypothetical protein